MLDEQMLFRYLVFVEWALFVITVSLLIVLSVLAGKLNKKRFIRLFLSSSISRESQEATMARLKKTEAALSAARINIIIPGIIFIISLSGIWLLLYKKYIHISIDAEMILLTIAAFPPIPMIIASLEFCLKKVINRADSLKGGG